MSRVDPKNREEAFTYQFKDDVKMLRAVSQVGEKEFQQALETLETHIQAYRSKRLRNACKKVEKKNKETKLCKCLQVTFGGFAKAADKQKRFVKL